MNYARSMFKVWEPMAEIFSLVKQGKNNFQFNMSTHISFSISGKEQEHE